jgi:hypothetical protein
MYLGEYTAADEAVVTNIAALERLGAPAAADLGQALQNLAEIRYHRGLPDDRVALMRRAVQLLEGREGSRVALVRAWWGLAQAEREAGDAAAHGHAERAVALCEEVHGTEGAPCSTALYVLATVIDDREPDRARRLLERAVELGRRSGITLDEATASSELARVAWALGDRQEARAAGERARELYARLGPTRAESLARLERWLADHPAPRR